MSDKRIMADDRWNGVLEKMRAGVMIDWEDADALVAEHAALAKLRAENARLREMCLAAVGEWGDDCDANRMAALIERMANVLLGARALEDDDA